jgi:SPP1 gp7 family putative phage head morphogenesis protein
MINLKYAFKLSPELAIKYFKSKGMILSWDWHDIWQEAHAKAFTVAKVARMDILQDIRDEVYNALNEGKTFNQFKKELQPILQKKGWWGKAIEVSPEGEAKKIIYGTPYRLKTIFRTNLQTSYMAGRYKQFIENASKRPYWQYVAVMDSRTREAHRLLHGKVFRYDDPFWNTHFPPNGYNCRCRVRALTANQVKAKGLAVEDGSKSITLGETILPTGEIKKTAIYTDPLTNKKVATDPGWAYNPGKESFFPDLDKYDYDIAKLWVTGGVLGEDFKAFYEGKTEGNYPVAVLNKEYKKMINSKTQVVYLSNETLKKQLGEKIGSKGHPELKFEDYLKLPEIIEDAQLIVKDGERTFVFYKRNEKIYYGAIKSTATGFKNFLTTFRYASKDSIERIKKKGVVIKDEL